MIGDEYLELYLKDSEFDYTESVYFRTDQKTHDLVFHLRVDDPMKLIKTLYPGGFEQPKDLPESTDLEIILSNFLTYLDMDKIIERYGVDKLGLVIEGPATYRN